MNRRAANRAILDYIYLEIEENPDLRFSQILRNLGVVKERRSKIDGLPYAWENEFHLEPWIVLDRMIDIQNDKENTNL
jgi:hypothetical protein